MAKAPQQHRCEQKTGTWENGKEVDVKTTLQINQKAKTPLMKLRQMRLNLIQNPPDLTKIKLNSSFLTE